MNRFQKLLAENGGTVPEDVIKGVAFRQMLRRMSDKEYDEKCVRRFKGMTIEQIEKALAEDIINEEDF